MGQETSYSRAAWSTVRPWSATAAPIATLARAVIRWRGGICGTDSVNVARGHAGLRHRQRRLVQVNRVGRPATGRSRGRVRTQECGCREICPQPGQQRALWAAVTSASIGFSCSSRTQETTSTPSKPSRRVVSLVKPVALLMILQASQLE
jgi:hypothetical protein